jgi:4-hydroxybenzoyl-CoA thioesterase/acyl-CoA thioester hydrolase
MNQPFPFERRVEFRDTDAAGIMHFSVYFTSMEQAEHAMFRSLGLSVVEQQDGQTISWPRVAATCDYRGSFRFEEIMTIQLRIAKLGKSSLKMQFDFSRDGELLATGTLTTVCCVISDAAPKSIPIPVRLRNQLTRFVFDETISD